MEADIAYQGCLPTCELHSRLLTVRRTGKSWKFVDIYTDSVVLAETHPVQWVTLPSRPFCYVISRLAAQPRDWNAISGFW